MQKQKGFVQGALLIGIALLAIVIGAFAMASNNNTSDISKEKAKTNAAVVVKKMADSFEQYQIKAAQEDLSKADALITGLTVALPQGFTKASYDLVEGGASGTAAATLVFNVTDKTGCAQINRVLGLTTDASDDNAISASSGKDEGCSGAAGYGGEFTGTYSRVFRKA